MGLENEQVTAPPEGRQRPVVTPFSWMIGKRGDGNVVLHLWTVTGETVLVMAPAEATMMAEKMQSCASGLVLADAVPGGGG